MIKTRCNISLKKPESCIVFAAEYLRQLIQGGNRPDPVDDFLQRCDAQRVARVPVQARLIQVLRQGSVPALQRGIGQNIQSLIHDFFLCLQKSIGIVVALRDIFAQAVINPRRPVVQDNVVFRRFPNFIGRRGFSKNGAENRKAQAKGPE